MVSIHNPEGTKSKVIYTTDSHRVALLAVGNERTVVHFQDNISRIVDVGEIGGNGVVVIDKVDITYGGLVDRHLGGVQPRCRTVSGVRPGEVRKLVEKIRRVIRFDEVISVDRVGHRLRGEWSLSVSRPRDRGL